MVVEVERCTLQDILAAAYTTNWKIRGEMKLEKMTVERASDVSEANNNNNNNLGSFQV